MPESIGVILILLFRRFIASFALMVLLLAGSVDALEGLCCGFEEQESVETVAACCDLHQPSEMSQAAGNPQKDCPKTCCSVDVPDGVLAINTTSATPQLNINAIIPTVFQPQHLLLETLVSAQLPNGPPLLSTNRLHLLLAVFLC